MSVPDAVPLVRLEGVTVVFRSTGWSRRHASFTAVRDADLAIAPGETLGLVGESGSGKTTLGRALLGLVPIERGRVRVGSTDLASFRGPPPLEYRKQVQAVFQDPLQALNPRHRVARLVGEPVRLHAGLRGAANRARVEELLGLVGLPVSVLPRRTAELSGGQRQRVAIARALAVDPEVLVLDEAVSALDVTTGAQILALLQRLRRRDGATLFISHDIARVRSVCDRVAVMYRGRIVEVGSADQICGAPQHPYTQLLVSSVPDPHPHRARLDEPPAPHRGPTVEVDDDGCPFAPRCVHADDRCRTHPMPVERDGRLVACHHVRAPSTSA